MQYQLLTFAFSFLNLFGSSLFSSWWAWPEVCQSCLLPFQRTSSWFYWFFSPLKQKSLFDLFFLWSVLFPSFCWLSVLLVHLFLIFKSHVCMCVCAKLLQLCLTLCNSVDHSPPGSSVHGILQASTLEWVATSSSRGSFWPRDRTLTSYISCIGRQVLYH